MTVDELYEYLCSPLFLDEKSGNIFYNYYIYQYPASQEYESRKSTEKINLLTSRINIYTLAVILVSTLLALTVVLTVVLVRKNRNLRNAQKLLINKNNDIMKSYRQTSCWKKSTP